jgi:methyl coenzyme M reductase beta subunit
MTKCAKCRLEISNEDLYDDHGLVVCEDCKMMNALSSPLSCATMKNMINNSNKRIQQAEGAY